MQRTLEKRSLTASAVAAVVILFAVMLVLFQSNLLDRKASYPVLPLTDNWSVTLNGETVGEGVLADIKFSSVKEGDVAVAATVLPKEPIVSAALLMEVRQGVVRAYLDEDLFYEFGEEAYRSGQMLKRGTLFLRMPDAWQGKTLTVFLTATEPQAFSYAGPVTLGNEQDLFHLFLQERRLPMLLGVFLVVYAVFQFLWLPYLFFRREGALTTTLFSVLITLVLGIYLLGYYDLFDLFLDDPSFSTHAEYFSLYSFPALFSAYLGQMLSGRRRQLSNFCAVLDTVLYGAVVLLHLMGLVHVTLFLTVFYLVAFTESAMFLAGIRGHIAELRLDQGKGLERITDYTILIGFFIFVICAFADAALYVFMRSFGTGTGVEDIPFMMVGSMCFTIALTAQFFLHGVSHLRADVTRGQLEQRAYIDPLTGLANRIRCEQEMTQLKMNEPFVIISFDLDGLKSVNDSLGHAEGDRMLRGFAKALQQCFEGMTLVGRMGGDEFLVILTGSECVVTDAKLRELEHALFDLNLEEPYFHYSVSYGYASNSETHFGNHVRDIYMLADRRMYDMKRKKKQEKEAEHA